MADTSLIVLGEITAAHGVRGLVVVRSFMEVPEDIFKRGPFTDEAGANPLALKPAGRKQLAFLARIDGVDTRDAAEALRGVKLCVPRERLPKAKAGEYYQHDLVGLAAVSPEGAPLGTVLGFHNYGAGDLIEIEPPPGTKGGSFLLPAAPTVLLSVEIDAGRVVIALPEFV